MLNGVLVEVRKAAEVKGSRWKTASHRWNTAHCRHHGCLLVYTTWMKRQTVPLLMLLNVSGMPLWSKLVVKRKTRVRRGGEVFYMSLLANRELE